MLRTVSVRADRQNLSPQFQIAFENIRMGIRISKTILISAGVDLDPFSVLVMVFKISSDQIGVILIDKLIVFIGTIAHGIVQMTIYAVVMIDFDILEYHL